MRRLWLKNNIAYLFSLVALLPALLLRDYTPGNELRYLSIADEALRNGTFFAFTNQGMPYADKPPLYFWLIMLSKSLLGHHAMWLLALFSLLPAWVTVRIMNRWADEEIDKEYQMSATWMMLSCGLFLGIAAFLRPDMLMCMFIILALYTFYRMLKGEGNRRRNGWLFPLYILLGLLSKGPVALVIPLLSTFVFLLVTKRLHTFGRYWGWKTWGVLIGGCALWWGCVYMEGGADYLNNLLFHQTFDRAVDSFHHKEPFYYYLVTMWYSFLPWSLLVIGTIAVALWRRQFHSELQKFFLSVAAVTLLFLSCISAKIEVYLLPAYPFFVYLAAMQFSRFRWNGWIASAITLPAVAFTVALPVLLWMARQPRTSFLDQPFLYAAGTVLTVCGVYALYEIWHWQSLRKSVRTLALGLFCALFVGGWAMPELNKRWGYAELCRQAVQVARERNLSGFYVYELHRAENMDVFLQEDVRWSDDVTVASDVWHRSVLLFPVKRLDKLRGLIPGAEIYIVGYYGYAVWPKSTENRCIPRS